MCNKTVNEKMKKIPARLHVLFAQKSSQAVIIRRGPSKQVAAIGWDRKDDSFTVGQWLKGKIYPYRSDMSPDGVYWIYFAMSDKGQPWTAVAKTPFLKALDFYPKNCAWNGGGLFASTQSYWLNDGGNTKHRRERFNSGLSVLPQWKNEPSFSRRMPRHIFLQIGTRWMEFAGDRTNREI